MGETNGNHRSIFSMRSTAAPPPSRVPKGRTQMAKSIARFLVAVMAVAAMALASVAGTGLAQAQTNTPTDRDALVTLYNATSGGGWGNNTNWGSDMPLSGWHGVTTDSDGRVRRLDLSDNQLSGEIPSELGSLSNLTHLYLHDNQLSGEIPSELGSLSNLEWLWLQRNQLSGVPPELGSLSNLERLHLSGNQLTEIPGELGKLSRLESLDLSGNQLSGVPSELGSLSNLERLDLSGNQLSGVPPELGSLSNLTHLYLHDNQLSGEIPSELGSLSNLEWLWLQRNQLSGVPPELGSLSNLERLHLSGNQLTEIPGELGKLSRLESLDLSGNQLSGVPSELGSLSNLERLDLSDNQLSGVPPELGSLSNLTHLYLHDNQLSGEIPSELGSLSNLEWLWLQRNQLSGVPPELGSLSNLERLHLSGNQLTEIPGELGKLSRLESLDLSGNQLSGVPSELGSLSNLERLDLSDNQLSGVPPELGSLSNLTHLYLHDNQLSGEIPLELGSLSNLEWLWLQRNQLTGGIPAELGSLSNLERLDLSDNQLSGPIPASLGGLANLERLSLSQNMLTGCVPEAWRDIAESDVLELGLPFCAVSLGTAPVFSDSEGNPITEAVRNVAENTAAGENVGAPVTAMDADNHTLTYSLDGTDMASFTVDNMGQIMVGAGTMLDYETKASYMVTVTATDPSGATGSIEVMVMVTNVDEDGTVTLSSTQPVVGTEITATLNDPDGMLSGEMWQWARSATMDGIFDPIAGATSRSYTPFEADGGMYLRVTAMYTDGEGGGKMAMSPSAGMVSANSAPVFQDAQGMDITVITRNVAENTAAGENVGAPVTAMDADNHTLTYSLGGTDMASFTVDNMGQIMVGAGTMLDYETKASYMVTVTATDPSGATGSIEVMVMVTNVDEDGTVTLSSTQPVVGTEITATLNDPDGMLSGEMWQWARSATMDGIFDPIAGATSRSYTPFEADGGMYLRVTAMYTDGEGGGKMAMSPSAGMVSANSAPVFQDAQGMDITVITRNVAENTAAGENVGAPVTAMDADNDTLTYSLGGTDMASFDIDPSTGQIMVGAGTMLDYETKASYMVTITATDPDSASDMITVPITVTNEEETGEVTLWAGMDALTMAPQVGDTITGAVMDPDGGVTGETWQWSRTMDDMDSRDMDSWVDIEDATDDEYTVMEGDTGYYLRVMAAYTDAVGTDTAMEHSMPTIMVTAEDLGTLGSRYDTDNNRLIDKEEAIAAVRDYFDDRLTKEETIEIIRLYFTSSS